MGLGAKLFLVAVAASLAFFATKDFCQRIKDIGLVPQLEAIRVFSGSPI